MGKVILIASGKGGVGKTTITAGLGWALAAAGHATCVIDTDTGLRDLDAHLGLENRVVFDLLDLCEGNCELEQALLSPFGHSGLKLLPAAQMARCKDLDGKAFRRVLRRLKEGFDFILIDCPAGIERGLRTLLSEEIDEVLLVCTPDDVCLRDAEQTLSLLARKDMPRPRLIVNRLQEALIASGVMYSAQTTAAVLDLSLAGEIPEDSFVYRAILTHQPLMTCPCMAERALTRIARRLAGEEVPLPAYGENADPRGKKAHRRRGKEGKRS